MIHDLDLALTIAGAEPLAVEAEGGYDGNQTFDFVSADITFDNGFTVIAAASRVAPARERTMTVTYPSGQVCIDFVTRAFSNSTPFDLVADFDNTVGGRDPLGASLAAFLAAVVGGAGVQPLASAAQGAKALDLALGVEQAVTN